jgi:5-hydroxyisourate hydrolase-like protein (transthyretin family)
MRIILMPPDKKSPRMQRLRMFSGAFVVILLLVAVFFSVATITTPSVVAATTHPIEYQIGCPPSMVNDGSLDYFKAHGFSVVHVVVPDTGTYQAELNKIKSLGMRPIIDVETVIWNGGQLQSTPITNFASYFQSLKNAGWEYVSSEGGRSGDLDYMAQYFKGYVNYNCDQCGLWKDMYKHSCTVANSWESYYTSEWSYIQQGAKEAAALGKQNGILAGVWEYGSDGKDYNPILTNSKNGGSPSYKSMLDWSYDNGIGFTHFHVWCGSNSQGLSRYKALGFEDIVANLQTYYPATSSAKTQTSTTITASTTTPDPYKYVTFTATITSGGKPLSGKSVSIYHYADGVRHYDKTANTDANGQVKFDWSWAGACQLSYYAATPGDSSYAASTSSELIVKVGGQSTSVALSASTTTPSPYQYVTFTATLTSGGNPLSGKSVSIYHYVDNVRYYDITANTEANGQAKLMKSWAGAAQFQYYAATPGDSSYAASTSSELAINVKSATSVALSASTTTPDPYQYVTFTATLTSGGNPLSGKSVSIYHYVDNVRYYDITANTDANGQVKLMKSWAGAAQFQYYAATPGDSSYAASTSSELAINVQ